MRSNLPVATGNHAEPRPLFRVRGFGCSTARAALLALCLLPVCISGADAAPTADPGLPYVYTELEHLTVKCGLPNDHKIGREHV